MAKTKMKSMKAMKAEAHTTKVMKSMNAMNAKTAKTMKAMKADAGDGEWKIFDVINVKEVYVQVNDSDFKLHGKRVKKERLTGGAHSETTESPKRRPKDRGV